MKNKAINQLHPLFIMTLFKLPLFMKKKEIVEITQNKQCLVPFPLMIQPFIETDDERIYRWPLHYRNPIR